MTRLRLAIDRGNQAVKWQAHLVDTNTNAQGKFASLLLENPVKLINPVKVAGKTWLYGSNAGKSGLALAVTPNQNGISGKIEHFAVVLAAVLQELSKQFSLGDSVEIQALGVTNPGASPKVTAEYKSALAAKKLEGMQINGQPITVSIAKDSIQTYAESAVILDKRPNHHIILDCGYGTVLGTVRAWDGVELATLDHGCEQIIKKISTHPDFLGGLAKAKLKAAPSTASIALQLAQGKTLITDVIEVKELLTSIVPKWYENTPLKMAENHLKRWAEENDRDNLILLTGGGAKLLALALGDKAEEWLKKHNCEIASDADYLAVRTVSELLEEKYRASEVNKPELAKKG